MEDVAVTDDVRLTRTHTCQAEELLDKWNGASDEKMEMPDRSMEPTSVRISCHKKCR